MWSGANGNTNGLLVPYLYNSGIISSNMFSFYLSSTDEANDSFIDFGAPNTAVMSTSMEEVVWLDVLNDDGNETWWTNKITGIQWDIKLRQAIFSLTETKAFTDTGTSCIMGPSLMIKHIKDTIKGELPRYYLDDYWGELFDCDYRKEMPSFWLLFGSYWFEVRPEDYAIKVTLSGLCTLCFQERSSDDYWVLGAAFMRGWYSIHDHESLKFGFVPYIDSPKMPPRLESL